MLCRCRHSRTTEATHAESEDVEQSAEDEMLSMADRLSIENQQLDRQMAATKTKTEVLEEELDQAVSKSPQSSLRAKEQQEGDVAAASAVQPKATGCPPKEEQP